MQRNELFLLYQNL